MKKLLQVWSLIVTALDIRLPTLLTQTLLTRRSPTIRSSARGAVAAFAVAATAATFAAPGTASAATTPSYPATPIDLSTATVAQLDALLANHTLTSVALTQDYLNRIQALSVGGPALNAVRLVNPDVMAEAAAADKTLASGAPHGPLLGIPVLLKDNIDVAGIPTTAGSVALQNSVPSVDAPLVTGLKKAGAVILGKANMTEFANYLSGNEPAGYSSLGGQVLNPYDVSQTPSGSSSGPAVAAAAGLAPLTVGSETSGSILSPSTANSDVGIKPTVGLVSRSGVLPISSTQDTAGPITKTVADAAAELTALDTQDSGDSATQGNTLVGHDFTKDLNPTALAGKSIGVVTGTVTCVDPKTAGAVATTTPTGAQCYHAATNYISAQVAAGSDAAVLYQNAQNVLTAQGATLVPTTLYIDYVAPLTPTADPNNATEPTVLQYDFKHDLDAYLSKLPASAPIHDLQGVIDYNNAHAQEALKFGQQLALQSQAVDLTDPTTKANYTYNRNRDIAQSKTVIDAVMKQENVSSLMFATSGSASIGAKAQYPSISIPAGYTTGEADTTASPYSPVPNGRPFNVAFLGQAYSEPTLIGYAYDYEQNSNLRQSPQVINPSLFRCTALADSPQTNCPAANLPVTATPTPTTTTVIKTVSVPGAVDATLKLGGPKRVARAGANYTYSITLKPSGASGAGRGVELYVDSVRRVLLKTGPKSNVTYRLKLTPGRHTLLAVYFGSSAIHKTVSNGLTLTAR